ncbi:MAG: hypothetical protein WA865_06540 [Spirulinaceae cyanobacterium]
MSKFRSKKQAFGHPGIESRWTHGSKQGIGTAYSIFSNAWLTLVKGWRGK